MAASPCRMLALAWLLIASLSNAGVTAEDEVITASTPPLLMDEHMVSVEMTKDTETQTVQDQVLVFPTVGPLDPVEMTSPAPTTEEAVKPEDVDPTAPQDADKTTDVPVTVANPAVVEAETQAPQPARGDGPVNIPKEIVPPSDVNCVSREAVQGRDSVSLKLKASSNCEDTRAKIASVLQELCGDDCKLDVYQEDNSDEIIICGPHVDADPAGMAQSFDNDNIKDKVGVEHAIPHWGKNSKLVLVSLLLAGLLLAALLVAGYYLKTHRKSAKGVRLAESFQVDEENQANTLVSVAPLPQEPLDKPTINGESPPENGTNSPPPTNGHSATQTPVADTEM